MSSHSSKVESEARAAPPAVPTNESAESAAGIASHSADATVLRDSTTLPEARHASLLEENEVAAGAGALRAKSASGDGTLITRRLISFVVVKVV